MNEKTKMGVRGVKTGFSGQQALGTRPEMCLGRWGEVVTGREPGLGMEYENNSSRKREAEERKSSMNSKFPRTER